MKDTPLDIRIILQFINITLHLRIQSIKFSKISVIYFMILYLYRRKIQAKKVQFEMENLSSVSFCSEFEISRDLRT